MWPPGIVRRTTWSRPQPFSRSTSSPRPPVSCASRRAGSARCAPPWRRKPPDVETATRGATPRRGPGTSRPVDAALRRTATGLGVAIGTGTLGLLGAAWHCATELLDPQRAGDAYTLRLIAVDGETVTLPATPGTQEPGVCCLQWPGGYGVLGAEVRAAPSGVQRDL